MTTSSVGLRETTDPTRVVGRRCVQFVLDRMVELVPVLLVGIVVGLWVITQEGSTRRALAYALLVVLILLYLALIVVVEIWLPLRNGGRTPAMRWLGLRMVNLDGTPPALKAYVIRALLSCVDGFLWGLVGIGMMLFSPRHQRFGDVIAGTLVIRSTAAAERLS